MSRPIRPRRHMFAFFVSVVPLLLAASCASWWAHTPEHMRDVAKILTCVMDAYDQGVKPLDIAVKCGVENADAVLDLITAQRAAEARHAKVATSTCPSTSAASAPAPSGSGSAKPAPSAGVKP